MPTSHCDVVVVGAGPAGLAAALAAADGGASVVLVDAGAAPGGQYWRHPTDPGLAGEVAGQHHGLGTYRRLIGGLEAHRDAGRLTLLFGHEVWTVGAVPDGIEVRAVERPGGSGTERAAVETVVGAASVVLAPGAYDRQVPFPGWTLPGVMTAGGVQALLKGSGTLAGSRVVVAGTGPFLLSVGAGLTRAGADVVAIHEAASPRTWVRHPGAVLRNLAKLGEGVGYSATLARRRVPYRTRSTVLAAHGGDVLETVTVARVDADGRPRPGSERQVRVDVLAVGWGFTPQVELPLALGCATRIDEDGSVVVVVDDDQSSSVAGVYVAGEACGVGGAALAVVEGRIAGAAAARAVTGSSSAARTVRSTRRDAARRAALREFATAMQAAYPVPPGWMERVEPDVVVCRCEETTAGRLRQVVDDLGAHDPRTAKLMARVGMGWCQGRVCGYAASCLVARWSGGSYRPDLLAERPVAYPVPLGVLAEAGDRHLPAADLEGPVDDQRRDHRDAGD